MDLENMRQNGVRSLDIQCFQCLHRVPTPAGSGHWQAAQVARLLRRLAG
jgi:hypothetical protein